MSWLSNTRGWQILDYIHRDIWAKQIGSWSPKIDFCILLWIRRLWLFVLLLIYTTYYVSLYWITKKKSIIKGLNTIKAEQGTKRQPSFVHANSSLHVQRRCIFETEHTCGASTAGMVRQIVVTWHFKVIKITCDLRMNATRKDIIYFKLAAIELFFTRTS